MSATPLPGILGAVAPVLDNYGYLAVAGLVMVESFGVPLPGETILVAASVYAGTGRLSILGVGLVAIAAAVVGNCIGYAIGYFGGHALVLRYGKYVFLTGERLEKTERFFARRGGLVVVAGRFIEGLRQAAGIIAGTAEMPWKRFLFYNVLGATLWVAVWAPLGYLAGDHIGTIYATATNYSLYLLIALVVLLAAWLARVVWRRRRSPAAQGAGTVSVPEAPDGDTDGSLGQDVIMAEMDYAGRAVLVFGAAGALGAGLVAAFAQAGASVTGADRQLPSQERMLDGVSYQPVDVLDDAALGALFDAGPVPWAVLNTIGGFAPHTPLTGLDPGELAGQLSLNLVSAALVTKHALRRMRPAGTGRIVHTASRAAQVTRGQGFAYSVSKLGVLHLVAMAADEVRGTGITVNCVVPSIIDTPANRAAMPDADHSSWPKIPDIARSYLFLASPGAHLVSGAAIPG